MTKDISMYSAMQLGRPYKTYAKTTLGQVYVKILDPFSDEQRGLILKGKGKEDSALFDVWSERQDVFFTRMNQNHFKKGILIEYKRPEVVEISEEERLNTLSDSALEELLGERFLTLQSAYNNMTSEAVVARLLNMAIELEKSEKIVNHIKARLAELQGITE